MRASPDELLHAALAAYQKNEFEQAFEIVQQAFPALKQRADAWTLFGMVQKKREKWDEAITAYKKAISLSPDYIDAYFNLSSAYLDSGRLEEAQAICEQGLTLRGDHTGGLTNLGCILQARGDLEGARVAFEKILFLKPEDSETHWNLALLHLLRGDYHLGWLGFEWRWRSRLDPLKIDKPRWMGEPLKGKRIFLYTEQGHGDALQCVRFIPEVAQRGGYVILQVRPELARLLDTVEGVSEIAYWEAPPPPFDVQCPLLSLPGVLGNRLETLPAKVPYVHGRTPVPAEAAALLNQAKGLKVAFVWAGNPNVKNDRWRSPRLPALASVLQVKGVDFFSVQMGDGLKDLAKVELPSSFYDLSPYLKDFSDTAAILQSVDLVLTTDTSVAHLAGALGCPTWVMLHANPDWRWFRDRTDSPWYPTARLFRQQKLGDWSDVAKALVHALEEAIQHSPRAVKTIQKNQERQGQSSTLIREMPSTPVPARLSDEAVLQGLQTVLGHYSAQRYEEAQRLLAPLLKAAPERVDAWTLQGMIHRRQGLLEKAIEAYREAARILPTYADAWSNLGNLLRDLKRFDEAVETYRQAVKVAYSEAFLFEAKRGLANSLVGAKGFEEARSILNELIAEKPHEAQLYFDRGIVEMESGHRLKAMEDYREALKYDPNYESALINLAVLEKDLGHIEASVALYDRLIAVNPHNTQAHSNRLFTMHYMRGMTQERLYQAHCEFGQAVNHLKDNKPFPHPKDPNKKLRIGMVSADFNYHAAAFYILPVLEQLDRSQFEVYCYMQSATQDRMTEKLKQLATAWRHTLGIPDAVMVEQIRADQIDILMDLSGHTSGNRLPVLARKLAPVQIGGWLGYFNTTGMEAMDYLLGTPYVFPPAQRSLLTETVWDFESSAACYRPVANWEIFPTPALERGHITFGSYNTPAKLTEEVLAVWARILKGVPKSRLVFANNAFNDQARAQLLLNQMIALGIEAERLEAIPFTFHAPRSAGAEVDILLDPFPYGGGSTTKDSLWAVGAPLITLVTPQALPIQRTSGDLLHASGLDELIAHSPEDYAKIAIELAQDSQKINQIRLGMRARLAELTVFNPEKFTREFETALRTMWAHWCDPKQKNPVKSVVKKEKSKPTASKKSKNVGQKTSVKLPASAHSPAVEKWAQTALKAYQAQQYEEGLVACESALKLAAQRFDLMALKGILLGRLKRTQEAVETYQKAIQLNPDYWDAYNNLSNILRAQQRHEELVELFERYVKRNPNAALAWSLLAEAYRLNGAHQKSEKAARVALEKDPTLSQGWLELGNALKMLQQLEPAIQAYQKAVELNPKSASAWVNQGHCYLSLQALRDAEAAFQSALGLEPNLPPVWLALGRLGFQTGRIEQGLQAVNRAIELNPNDAGAYVERGNLLQSVSRTPEALISFQHALSLNSHLAPAHLGVGVCYYRQGRQAEARACFERSLAIEPRSAEAWNNLGNIHKDRGELTEAVNAYRHVLTLQPDNVQVHSNLLMAILYAFEFSPMQILEEHQAFDRLHAQKLRDTRPYLNTKDPNRPLRIGYLSGDLRRHAVAYYIEPIFARHDPKNVEIYGYYNYQASDDVTARLKSFSKGWCETMPLNDEELAEKIRADRIDILVDLSGHTAYNRLLAVARKPAPIQMCWIGYPSTTGLSAIDYRFSESFIEPEGVYDEWSSETIWRLPEAGATYIAKENCPPPRLSLPAEENGYLTFGSFNTFAKVSDEVIELWGAILERVPTSKMLIEAPGLDDAAFQEEVFKRFQRAGVERSRLTLLGRVPENQYILYNKVDMCLDPFPYNGGTTSCDTLWMGVPFVSIAGQRLPSRMGLAMLANAGVKELCVDNKEDYVELAVRLATDWAYLKSIRVKITREALSQSALFNPDRFIQHLEAAYRAMWTKWCTDTQ